MKSPLVLATVLAIAVLAVSGCTSSRMVHRADLDPGVSFARSLVYLHDGTRYEFERVAVFPDTVVGEYKVNVEREAPDGGLYYRDEVHAHHMALATVDSLAILRRDSMKTVLYGAGAVGVGYLVYRALNTSDGNNGGHGKPADFPVWEISR
jgi:hypothetical protein